MTATAETTPQAPSAPLRAWPVVSAAIAASAALAGVATLLGPGSWYPWALAAAVAIGAGAIGANDAVSLKLPNRFTGAFAAAAGIQALAVALIRDDWAIALWAAVAGVALFLIYVVLGVVGWVGFGDAKFAAGLAIAAGIPAGLGALYVFPVAIVVTGIWRLGSRRQTHRPHGPALAIAAVLVMAVAGITSASGW